MPNVLGIGEAGNKFVGGTDVIETVAFPGGHVAILISPIVRRRR
jgi:hypothetical protein